MLFFGRNLDAHEPRHPMPAPLLSHSAKREILLSTNEMPRCLEGKDCYVSALYLTMFMTFSCILLSVWAGWRDRQKLMGLANAGQGKRSRSHGRVSIERR
jgi:hypothetical protein